MGVKKELHQEIVKKEVMQIESKELNSLVATYTAWLDKVRNKKNKFPSFFLDVEGRRAKGRKLNKGLKWMVDNRVEAEKMIRYMDQYYGLEDVLKNVDEGVIDYDEYLKSADWLKRKERFIKNVGICIACGTDKKLLVHHNKYYDSDGSILGREKRKDIAVLCWDCHTDLHKEYGRGASFGFKEIRSYKESKMSTDLGANIILKNGKEINIDAETFGVIKDNYLKGNTVSVFNDAIIPHDSILVVLRTDSYKALKGGDPEEDFI